MRITKEIQKKWESLELSNDFIFKHVLRNLEICKRVLSEIMGHEIEKIEFSAYEKTIEGIFTTDEFSAILEKEVENIKNFQDRRAWK